MYYKTGFTQKYTAVVNVLSTICRVFLLATNCIFSTSLQQGRNSITLFMELCRCGTSQNQVITDDS